MFSEVARPIRRASNVVASSTINLSRSYLGD